MPPKTSKPAAKKPAGAAKSSTKKPTATKAAAAAPAAAKQEAKPVEPEPEVGVTITIKQLAEILFKDPEQRVKKSGKWPLLIDGTGQAATFLRYQNTNYLNALEPRNMETEAIRLGILGGLRYGKPVIFDMMESDMYEVICDKLEEIQSGLTAMLMDGSIVKNENFMKLVKDIDGEQYKEQHYTPMELENFMAIFITQNELASSAKLLKLTYPVRIEAPK